MNENARRLGDIEVFTGPSCDYCRRAKAVLARHGLNYREIDVSSAEGREEMQQRLPRTRSIPQIFIAGRHVGGCQDLERLDADGTLGDVAGGGDTGMSSRVNRLITSIGGMPHWVQFWLLILMGTNMTALAFFDTQVGIWTAAAFAVVCAFNMPMMLIQGGLTRLLSFPHFVWFPLVGYLYVQLFGATPLPQGSTIRAFALTALVVNATSLAFDVLEVHRWLKGRREVLGLSRARPLDTRAPLQLTKDST